MITEYEIPVKPSIGHQEFTTTLASVPYLFQFRWNARDEAWYMNVREVDLTPIVLGAKIVLGCFIGRRSQHVLFRRGVIVAHDITYQHQEAGYDDIGKRVIVKYIPALDILRRLTTNATLVATK